jgi:hypothetical protein
MEQFADKWLEIAKQVGGEAWPILVKQMYITAWTRIAVAGLLFVMSVVGTVITWVYVNKAGNVLEKPPKDPRWDSYSINDRTGELLGIGTGSLILTAICLLFMGAMLVDWLPALIYPEGEALERLISAMGR